MGRFTAARSRSVARVLSLKPREQEFFSILGFRSTLMTYPTTFSRT
jgi:hypothetical protein